MKLLAVLILTAASFAQTIPPGTILPVQLNSTLRSKKAGWGQAVSARIMQDVPLPGGHKIHAGSKVLGHVISVTPARANAPARITFTLDHVAAGKERLPVSTNLRALASMVDVAQAQIPQTGPDRGTSQDSWTTVQIGGEVVYGRAAVANGTHIIGSPLAGGGVLAPVAANPGAGCRGAVEGNDSPQALWVFSSDACGVYGYPDLLIAHAGKTDPLGQITLESTEGNLNIRSGSGLLLRVNATGPSRDN